MTEKKQNTPWKDWHVAEIALVINWCVIAILTVYWSLPKKTESTEPSKNIASVVQSSTTQHTRASEKALTSAIQYLSQLDSAMAEGMRILKTNQLSELAAHSRVFKSLLQTGHAQFGRSVFEPLGRCSSAGGFANSWWGQAQLSAARQGGSESIPGAIQNSLDEYTMNRAECLKQADPSTAVASQD